MRLNSRAPRGAASMAKAGEEAEATLVGTVSVSQERRHDTQMRDRAPSSANGARVLMCAPTHFCVDYTINPWMENQIGKADNALAIRQWTNLARLLAREAELAFVAPAPGLPDMVFTANAGLAIGGTAVVSHFAAKERQAEERPFRAWFEAEGFEIAPWPSDIAFEGAGDALLDDFALLDLVRPWLALQPGGGGAAGDHIRAARRWSSSRRSALLSSRHLLLPPRRRVVDLLPARIRRGVAASDSRTRPSQETHRGRRGRRPAVRVQRRRGQWTRLHERRLGGFTAPLARGRVQAGVDGSFGIPQSGRGGQMSDVEIDRDIGAARRETTADAWISRRFSPTASRRLTRGESIPILGG